MPLVRRLEEKDAAGLEDAGDLGEYLRRAVEVFDDIVGDDDVERGVRVRDCLASPDAPFIEKGIHRDPLVRVDAAHASYPAAEVHLWNDAGSGAQIEQPVFRPQHRQDLFLEQDIVPIRFERRVEASIQPARQHSHLPVSCLL